MTFLRTLDRALSRVEFSLLVLFLSSMIILSFTQVFLRNALGTGLVWADTIIRHLVIWVGFVGAALAATEERHIGIDALTKFLPPRFKHAAQALTSLFAVIASVYLGDAAWTYLKDELTSGGELVLGIQTWQALLIIPAGYVLIAFHFLVKFVGHALGVFGRYPQERD
jgi:TRAP-type C4-dicarboxylate transport system permease small subunit